MKKKICSLVFAVLMVAFLCSNSAKAGCTHDAFFSRVTRTWMAQASSHSHVAYDHNGNPYTYPCMIMCEYEEREYYCPDCGYVDPKKETIITKTYHRRAY